jgi:hypothetical protein
MEQSTNIVPLLVGGGLALAGTVVSQVFGLLSGWLDRRHRRRAIHRERFEELADCLFKTKQWRTRLDACRSLQDIQACQPPPEVDRMVCLTIVYFPQFHFDVISYTNGLHDHYRLMIKCFDPNLSESASTQTQKAEDTEKQKRELWILGGIVMDDIEEHGRRYTLA